MPTAGQGDTLILADPGDPYYPLAEEIAQHESLPIAHTLDQVLEQAPTFLLWVVSPTHLSDEALIAYGLAVRDRPSAISLGILSGNTLEEARGLWLRAPEVEGEQIVAANAANPQGNITPGITVFDRAETTVQPLTRANLLQGLLWSSSCSGLPFLPWAG